MSKHYLVTGGTGFLGSGLVKGLLKAGHRVRVFDNNSRGKTARIGDVLADVEFIEGDIRDADSIIAACEGVDGVCHLAYINGTRFFYEKPELVLEVAVKGMMNVLDGCLKHNVPEFILASSSEVYQTPSVIPTPEDIQLIVPDPQNPRYSYGGGKIICELLALNYGRTLLDRVVVFRPHNVYGPDMGFEHVLPEFALRMNKLNQATPEGDIEFGIQGTGEETRAFVYIDDFVDGLLRVIDQGEHMGIYNIGTTDERTVATVAREVANWFDRQIKVVPGKLQQGSTSRRCPDITRLKALGYAPKISFSEGVARTVAWYVANEENSA